MFQTEPPAGAVAALGSDVQVMVSKGPATTDVPDVVGKKAGDTVETLSGAGFVVADTTVFSDEPNGQVCRRAPRAVRARPRAQPSRDSPASALGVAFAVAGLGLAAQ